MSIGSAGTVGEKVLNRKEDDAPISVASGMRIASSARDGVIQVGVGEPFCVFGVGNVGVET